jgi:hypothetical protein
MPAFLRQDLVFDLDRVGTCPLQRPDRVVDVDRIAEAGVGIDGNCKSFRKASRDITRDVRG